MPLDWQGMWGQPGADMEHQNDVQSVLGPDEDNWRAISCVRTNEEQAEDYAKGRDADGNVIDEDAVVTNAKPGHSAHNWGIATDFGRVVGFGISAKVVYDYDTSPAWPRVWQKFRDHPRLHTGQDFPKDTNGRVKADPDHVQSQQKWLAIKAQLQAEGKW